MIDGVCEDCAAGFYKSGIGIEKCSQCPAGSVQPNMGEADCTFCTEGLYPNQDQTFCSTCSAGEFVVLELLNGTEIGKCEPCPANTFAPAATTATARPAGRAARRWARVWERRRAPPAPPASSQCWGRR